MALAAHRYGQPKWSSLIPRQPSIENPKMDVVRNSVKRSFSAQGRYKEYPADNIAYAFAPLTRKVLGRSIEGAISNLLEYSNYFVTGSTPWTGQTVSSQVNSVFDGEQASRYDMDDGFGIFQEFGSFTGNKETSSVIVENDNSTSFEFRVYDFTDGVFIHNIEFDWSTESFTQITGNLDATKEKLASSGPNGGKIFRFYFTFTGTAGNNRRIYPIRNWDGYIVLHHTQHEEQELASSPIVTTNSAVERKPDHFTYVDLTHINASEGTVLFKVNNLLEGIKQTVFEAFLDANNRMVLFKDTDDKIYFKVIEAGTTVVNVNTRKITNFEKNTAGISFAENSFRLCLNGNTVVEDLSGSIPPVTQINVGRNYNDSNYLNAYLLMGKIAKRRSSKSELKRITSKK